MDGDDDRRQNDAFAEPSEAKEERQGGMSSAAAAASALAAAAAAAPTPAAPANSGATTLPGTPAIASSLAAPVAPVAPVLGFRGAFSQSRAPFASGAPLGFGGGGGAGGGNGVAQWSSGSDLSGLSEQEDRSPGWDSSGSGSGLFSSDDEEQQQQRQQHSPSQLHGQLADSGLSATDSSSSFSQVRDAFMRSSAGPTDHMQQMASAWRHYQGAALGNSAARAAAASGAHTAAARSNHAYAASAAAPSSSPPASTATAPLTAENLRLLDADSPPRQRWHAQGHYAAHINGVTDGIAAADDTDIAGCDDLCSCVSSASCSCELSSVCSCVCSLGAACLCCNEDLLPAHMVELDRELLTTNLFIEQLVGPEAAPLLINLTAQLLSLFTVQPTFHLLSRVMKRNWHLVPALLKPITMNFD